MPSKPALLGVTMALCQVSLQAAAAFSFCQDDNCEPEKCPFYANANTGFPECVVYDTKSLKDFGYKGDGQG